MCFQCILWLNNSLMLFWIAVVITMFLFYMDLTIAAICTLVLAFFNAELILFCISYELKFSMESCNVMINWLNLLFNFGLVVFAWLITFQSLFAFFLCIISNDACLWWQRFFGIVWYFCICICICKINICRISICEISICRIWHV